MLAKEKVGRTIDPWRLMSRAATKSLAATEAFMEDRNRESTCRVFEADARLIIARWSAAWTP